MVPKYELLTNGSLIYLCRNLTLSMTNPTQDAPATIQTKKCCGQAADFDVHGG